MFPVAAIVKEAKDCMRILKAAESGQNHGRYCAALHCAFGVKAAVRSKKAFRVKIDIQTKEQRNQLAFAGRLARTVISRSKDECL